MDSELQRGRWSSLLLLLALTPACSSDAYFLPRENATGMSPTGIPAAEYRLDSVGELRVWARKASVQYENDVERVVLELGFELENNSPDPIEILLEDFELTTRASEGPPMGPFPVAHHEGELALDPGESGEIQIWFHPEGLDSPRDIAAFDLRWRLRRVGGGEFSESAKFLRAYRDYGPYGYYGPYPYYPRYWGYWGGYYYGRYYY
ncbi:MAG: hypothetical protein ACYTG5_02875 [Planctomycetota bacterium]|jgi:hypothetical protein